MGRGPWRNRDTAWDGVLYEIENRDRSECWLYWGSVDDPRPRISVRGRGFTSVSRAVLAEVLGRDIGDGLFALHRCDVPSCYNPDHPYEGTQLQNIRDAIERGRFARGERWHALNKPENRASGQRHSFCVVKNDDVPRIFLDDRPSSVVARDFGISPSIVRMIWSGKRKGWLTEHLDPPPRSTRTRQTGGGH